MTHLSSGDGERTSRHRLVSERDLYAVSAFLQWNKLAVEAACLGSRQCWNWFTRRTVDSDLGLTWTSACRQYFERNFFADSDICDTSVQIRLTSHILYSRLTWPTKSSEL